MKRLILFAVPALILVACTQPQSEAEPTPPETAADQSAVSGITPSTAQDSPSGGIGISTAGAGGMAPVTGSDVVGGGGSGVGAAAKEQAKSLDTTSTAADYYDDEN